MLCLTFPFFPRIFLHPSDFDCVPLFQNLHHPAEGSQQKKADQDEHRRPGPGLWGETGTQKTQTPTIRMVLEEEGLCVYISIRQSLICMHYIPVLRQESENKQMRIEMVRPIAAINTTSEI